MKGLWLQSLPGYSLMLRNLIFSLQFIPTLPFWVLFK